ncbi:MAG TPA: insulinase family protein, partial [Bacillota bacterium]
VRVYEDLMAALYQQHPVRVPVIGTVEDIRRITPDLLHTCHRTFYHPANMLLAVIGDVDPDAVLDQIARDLAGRRYGPAGPIQRLYPDEPPAAAQRGVRRPLPTSEAYAAVGIKLAPPVRSGAETEAHRLAAQRRVLLLQLALDALIGPASAFFQRLYDEGVFTDAFGYQVDVQPGAAHLLVSGRTGQPDRFCAEVLGQLCSAAASGFDPADFERVRRARLGSFLSVLDNADALNGLLVRDRLLGFDFLRTAELLRGFDVADGASILGDLVDQGRATWAIVEPKGAEQA